MKDEYYDQLGRKLYAAYISQQLGIGLGYAFKKYAGPEDGPFPLWTEIAKHVSDVVQNAMNQALREPMGSDAIQ